MTGAEIAGLGWLSAFLNNVLASVVGDRLKKKPSHERAKERAYELFESLQDVRYGSAAFVDALRDLCGVEVDPAERAKHTEPRDDDDEVTPEGALWNAISRVSYGLVRLTRALNEVDPQLGVHAPEVAEEVAGARSSRALVISEAEQRLGAFANGYEDVAFTDILQSAETAHSEIESATDAFRVFLANEFSFKESF